MRSGSYSVVDAHTHIHTNTYTHTHIHTHTHMCIRACIVTVTVTHPPPHTHTQIQTHLTPSLHSSIPAIGCGHLYLPPPSSSSVSPHSVPVYGIPA